MEPEDIYTELLGVPPGPRPPNHYEILRLSLFEADKRIIHDAVLRQMATLKLWVLDPRRMDRIQGLMNEVGLASFILEDPEYRPKYERELADRLGIPPPERAPAAPPETEPEPAPAPLPLPAGVPHGSRYDVSVGNVVGMEQERLAQLLAVRRGISFGEAWQMSQAAVVLVCEDAPEAEANDWRRALAAAGLEPRIGEHGSVAPPPAEAEPGCGPAPVPPPAETPREPRYDVSVAKPQRWKQERLARMLAARHGIPDEDAWEICQNAVITVCRDAPEAEANAWRIALVAAGLEPRIRKHEPMAPPPAPAAPRHVPVPARPLRAPQERYDVSVARVQAREQGKLATMLTARKGIPYNEAWLMSRRGVVMVFESVPEAEAMEWRNALVALGIYPSVRRHMSMAPRRAPGAPRAAIASLAPPGAPQEPRYDVSVAKLGGEKQEKLAELLAMRLGIPYLEASQMSRREVVMVCKDVSEAEAIEWRKALILAGIEPRVRKH